MSHTDPIADMITRIKNAQRAGHAEVLVPTSKLKIEIAKVLKSEGYVDEYSVLEDGHRSNIKITLRYFQNSPVIREIKRASKPGLRKYQGVDELQKICGGYGISILTTSRGVMSNREAKRVRQGGEVLCYVW